MVARLASNTDALPSAAPAQRAELRVLLAEDNCIAAELLKLMGRRLGARIDWVENGLDAIDSIHRARAAGMPYELLLMDAMMPVLSGVDATRRLRAGGVAADELPIVAVTAATATEEVRGFFDAGMQAYLAKPVSVADLSACFDAWVPDRSGTGVPVGSRSLSALRKRYELRKSEVFARLEEAIAMEDWSPETADELRNLLHKLAGTAGSFGEERLSKAAAEGATLVGAALPASLSAALPEVLALLEDGL